LDRTACFGVPVMVDCMVFMVLPYCSMLRIIRIISSPR
jgi:hypothetical protein